MRKRCQALDNHGSYVAASRHGQAGNHACGAREYATAMGYGRLREKIFELKYNYLYNTPTLLREIISIYTDTMFRIYVFA
ncbi:hypothetical protein GCM10022228_04880 [Halomonas cibimaris]|uniref:Uncharacterized protein n=1 Tax=Halomonas cibimaris TaxID=657012 RepID=A0ABP7LE44_9GAMM